MSFSTAGLQKEKIFIDEYTPNKLFKNEPVTNMYINSKALLADEMR